MKIDILTLFPKMIEGLISQSIIKRAIEKGSIEINIHDYREFSSNKNKKVDDYPYGGGAGMLITPEPIVKCLKNIKGYDKATKIITSAQGKIFNQKKAKQLSKEDHIIIVCGHYEGIDNRILKYVDEEISIGDYILTGGEIASMAIIDAVIRLIPDVLGNKESYEIESFDESLLEYPQYTRPEIYDGQRVPEVLLSGNHEKIRVWRRYMSLKKTFETRPDLIKKLSKSDEDEKLLEKIMKGEKYENFG